MNPKKAQIVIFMKINGNQYLIDFNNFQV